MIILKGLPQKALDFLSENSTFNKYQIGQRPIGCGKSEGTISYDAQLDEEWLYGDGKDTIRLYLFKYTLGNGIIARDRIQKVETQEDDTLIYTQLEIVKKGNSNISLEVGERIRWEEV